MFAFQKTYTPAIEQLLRQYYQSLSEKDGRRFAAVEAIKLGHGGIRYIANVLGYDPHTVKEGMRELKQLPADPRTPRSANQEVDGKRRKKNTRTCSSRSNTPSKIGLQATPCVRVCCGRM